MSVANSGGKQKPESESEKSQGKADEGNLGATVRSHVTSAKDKKNCADTQQPESTLATILGLVWWSWFNQYWKEAYEKGGRRGGDRRL